MTHLDRPVWSGRVVVWERCHPKDLQGQSRAEKGWKRFVHIADMWLLFLYSVTLYTMVSSQEQSEIKSPSSIVSISQGK